MITPEDRARWAQNLLDRKAAEEAASQEAEAEFLHRSTYRAQGSGTPKRLSTGPAPQPAPQPAPRPAAPAAPRPAPKPAAAAKPAETPRQKFWGNVAVAVFCAIVVGIFVAFQYSGDSCETISTYYAGYHDSYQSCTDDDTGENYVLP